MMRSKQTIEGAGVHLKRVFGFTEAPALDPFLLLDDFHSDEPEHYLRGFPWHPHRGIETITYVLHGEVEHSDSMGNTGVISSGDVQWMTAGSGIIHQEMPKGDASGFLWGFQLWANLPSSHKMMRPRYRGLTAEEIPEVVVDGGARVRVICGEVNGARGPVTGIVIDPEYIDVSVPPLSKTVHPVKRGHTVVAYVLQGKGRFGKAADRIDQPVSRETAVLFEDGDQVVVSTEDEPVRFLLISGRPIGEPVAWRGPIVMNTQEELQIAFEEYRRGTFIRHP
jgi:redox-sensitive bicupin YhaK (pirin superfamily)